MSPFYDAFERMFAGIIVAGFLLGVVGGLVAWSTRANVILGLALTGASFALVLAFDESPRVLVRLGAVGLPPLVLGYLACHLAARELKDRTTWGFPGTGLAAFALALSVGGAILLFGRWNLWAPVWIALGADILLVVLWIRTRVRGEAG